MTEISLVIQSTDTSAKKNTTTVTNINTEATNAQIKQLAAGAETYRLHDGQLCWRDEGNERGSDLIWLTLQKLRAV